MDLIQIIGISTVCALFGVFAGSTVQRVAKFLYPTDWMSMLTATVIMVDAVIDVAPWDKIWYVPFAAGYVLGYLLIGRTNYIMVMNISMTGKIVSTRPWVLYDHEGNTCLQKQRNRDLLRRQFLGIHTKVVYEDGTPMQAAADWHSDAKYPMFPKFEKPLIVLENVYEQAPLVRIWWRFKAREPLIIVRVGYASEASKLALLHSADVLERQQVTIVRLNSEINELLTAQGPALMEMAIRVNSKAEQTTPENRMLAMLKKEDRERYEKYKPQLPVKEANKMKETKENEETGGEKIGDESDIPDIE